MNRCIKAVILGGCFVSTFAVGPAVKAVTIQHRFDFEDETADDSVGGLEGQLMGDPDFTDDAPSGNKAVVLEGGQYVLVDDDMDFGSEFSLTMWVQPDSSAVGIQNLIGNAPGGWDTDGFKLYYNTWSAEPTADGALILETGDGEGGLEGNAVRSDVEMVYDEVWTHVAATINVEDDEVMFFVDGELLFTSGGLNVDMKTDGPFEIGRMLNGWDLHGLLDDVQIYDGILSDEEVASLFATPGSAIGFEASLPGDYNRDQQVDVLDIDLQAIAMQDGNPDLSTFDENADGMVDNVDRSIWVRDHAGTWLGDSNLDGEFNSSDFVFVFTAGKYETGDAAGWAEGDWNGDALFTSSDFVTAFSDGGYESGPRAAVSAVPEPSSLVLLLVGMLGFATRRRRAGR